MSDKILVIYQKSIFKNKILIKSDQLNEFLILQHFSLSIFILKNMNEDLHQTQPETILNSHTYLHSNKRHKQVQYEVKYQGESYLNTKWVTSNNVSQQALIKYEGKLNKEQNNNRRSQSYSQSQKLKLTQSQKMKLAQSQKMKQNKNYTKKVCLLTSPIRTYNRQFAIQINSSQRKPHNHYIYKDRVIKILKEVYKFNEKIPNTSKVMRKLIQLELRQQYLDRQYQTKLVEEIYPTLREIKKMKDKAKQRTKAHTLNYTVDIQVLWDDYTTSLVKIQYINMYQREIAHQYQNLREQIKQKYLILIEKQPKIQQNQMRKIPIIKDAKQQQENKIGVEVQRKISLRFNMIQEQAKVKKIMQLQKKPKQKYQFIRQSKLQSLVKKQFNSKGQKSLIFQQQTSQQKSKPIQID